MGGESVTHQHDQHTTTVQVLHGSESVLGDGHGKSLAKMDLAGSRAGARLGLSLLDCTETALLLGQRGLKLGVGIVLDEALGRKLFWGGGEDGLAEVLGAQLTDKSQAGGGEEHLLADLGGVGDICDGRQAGSGIIAAEEGIEGFVGLEVRLEGGQVVVERVGGLGEELDGSEGLAVDGDEKAEVFVAPEESVELGDKLLGG